MSQLQVTGEAKIRDIQGPVVANSGVVTALDGDASQYVRGDGTLADFPTSTGGGSSVSYYLNSSVSQGTIGGVAYRQLGKTPIIGAGTDITISANGYVASYITDANDPALLEVPAGNFNCEFYFSVNSNNHNPFVYAEVYKYDGTTFSLIGTSVGVPEYLSNGTTLSPYYFAIPVSQTALTITDRIAIRIYVNVDGRVVTLHTENGHLCQVVTTFSKGLTSLNNLTRQVQFLGTGTSGTDFNISSVTATHTFNLPVASASNTGKLSSTDWSTFNTAYNNMIVSAAVTGTTTKTLTLTQQDAGTITASWTDDNTDAVTSVFGRTGAVVATSGDYNTSQVTELTNLYFTDARARLALSLTTTGTSGAANYNSTTGVFNIPQYQAALTNPVTGTGLNGAIPKFTTTGSTIGSSIIFDSGTQIGINTLSPSFTLDVNGTARVNGVLTLSSTISNGTYTYTLPSATGTLALTSQIPSLSGYVQGTGNANYVALFNGTSSIGNSIIYQSGTNVGIMNASPTTTLDVTGGGQFSGSIVALSFIKSGGTSAQILAADGSVITAGTNITISGGTISTTGSGITGSGTTNYLPKFTGASSIGNSLIFDNGTNIGIGLTSPSYKLDVQDNGVSGIVDVASFSVTGNGGSGRGVGILLGAAGSSNSVQVARLVGYHELAISSAVAASFAIQVANSSGTLTERLRITQAGNLIINTTTDGGFRLNVNGTGNFTGALTGTSATFSDIVTNTTGGYRTLASQGYILRNDANNANLGGLTRRGYWVGGSALDTQIFAETGYGIFLNVNGSQAGMAITSGGSVGIGTMSPSNTLHVYNTAATDAMQIQSTQVFSTLAFRSSTNSSSVTVGIDGAGNASFENKLSSGAMTFVTNGSERARITSGGDISFNGGSASSENSTSTPKNFRFNNDYSNGTTDASLKLYLFNNGSTRQGLTSGPSFDLQYHSSGNNTTGQHVWYIGNTQVMKVQSTSGNVTIASLGTGTVTATSGTLSTVSDMNLKNEDGFINNALDKVLKLKPRYYHWKKESGLPTDLRQLGFYAQEVNEALGEEAANTPKTENDKWGIYDRGMIAFLTAAIQEQQVQIEELKQLIKNK